MTEEFLVDQKGTNCSKLLYKEHGDPWWLSVQSVSKVIQSHNPFSLKTVSRFGKQPNAVNVDQEWQYSSDNTSGYTRIGSKSSEAKWPNTKLDFHQIDKSEATVARSDLIELFFRYVLSTEVRVAILRPIVRCSPLHARCEIGLPILRCFLIWRILHILFLFIHNQYYS